MNHQLARLRSFLDRQSDLRVALLICLATAVLALIFVWPRQWTRGLLINDEYWHAYLARNLAEGQGYVADSIAPLHAAVTPSFPAKERWKQPLYPALVSLIWRVIGDFNIRAMLAISIAFFAIGAALTYALARRLDFEKGSALAIAFLSACTTNALATHITGNPEAMYWALFTAMVLVVIRPTGRNVAAAGALGAALVLIKGHGLLYLPVLGAYCLWQGGPKRLLQWGGGLLAAVGIFAVAFPDGLSQLLRAGNTYSLGLLLWTDAYPGGVTPWSDLSPVDPWAYFADRPQAFAFRVLRMVSRTKNTLDAMAAPAVSGFILPSLVLAVAATLRSLRRQWFTQESDEARHQSLVWILILALIGITFGFFWFWRITPRYLLHVYPLLLLVVFRAARELAPGWRAIGAQARAALVVCGIIYFIGYPMAFSVWRVYREPFEFLGRMLAVRFVDYDAVQELVTQYVPQGGVVITDLNHEVAWLTRRYTVAFPLKVEDLRSLVEQYDAVVVLEHPSIPKDWAWLRENFVLLDDQNGRFWLRRDQIDN